MQYQVLLTKPADTVVPVEADLYQIKDGLLVFSMRDGTLVITFREWSYFWPTPAPAPAPAPAPGSITLKETKK
jgi:hypothetical protein